MADFGHFFVLKLSFKGIVKQAQESTNSADFNKRRASEKRIIHPLTTQRRKSGLAAKSKVV
jgi:ribosomal protein S20